MDDERGERREMGSAPEVIRDKAAMRSWSRSRRSQGKTVALVPTMGFLHDGHLALIRAAHPLADLTVVSIYVNPGQFAPSEDFSTYPSDLTGDLKKLADLGIVHAVFCPSNLYDYEGGSSAMPTADRVGSPVSCIEVEDDGSGHETWIRVEKLERGLCGKSRPVFFRGVATVVAKLFNIVEPDVAIFGKKDYQQWRIICRMVRDLDFAVKIVGSEIVRESDGLAMSSRNVRLSPEERVKALSIYNSMSKAKYTALHEQTTCQEIKDIVIQMVEKAGGRIDYVEEQRGNFNVDKYKGGNKIGGKNLTRYQNKMVGKSKIKRGNADAQEYTESIHYYKHARSNPSSISPCSMQAIHHHQRRLKHPYLPKGVSLA